MRRIYWDNIVMNLSMAGFLIWMFGVMGALIISDGMIVTGLAFFGMGCFAGWMVIQTGKPYEEVRFAPKESGD